MQYGFQNETDAQMGSWLSSFKNKLIYWVAGKGNSPGTPETRAGVAPTQDDIATQVAAILAKDQTGQATPIISAPTAVDASQMNKVLIIGGGFVAAYLLLGKRHK